MLLFCPYCTDSFCRAKRSKRQSRYRFCKTESARSHTLSSNNYLIIYRFTPTLPIRGNNIYTKNILNKTVSKENDTQKCVPCSYGLYGFRSGSSVRGITVRSGCLRCAMMSLIKSSMSITTVSSLCFCSFSSLCLICFFNRCFLSFSSFRFSSGISAEFANCSKTSPNSLCNSSLISHLLLPWYGY